MNSIEITSEYSLGAGAPCFVLAEVGINHNGDRKLGEELIAAAAEAGAHGVKFQNYQTEDFISDRSQTYTYTSQGQEITEPMFGMFKRYEIDFDFISHMKGVCDDHNLLFTSTPTGQKGIDDLMSMGAPVLKNGSDYLTNLDFIRRLGETGLPVILSCGMSTLGDIDEAVRAFQETGNDRLILLHCTSSYPTPSSDVHLRKIESLQQIFDMQVGFSDHTEGPVAGLLAASMGACMIEKHFTLDRNLPGPDHRFSCGPSELAALVKGVVAAREMMGDPKLGPTEREGASRNDFRMSCIAAKSLPAGHRLLSDDVTFKRPGAGLPPNAERYIVGRRLKRNIGVDVLFSLEDFE